MEYIICKYNHIFKNLTYEGQELPCRLRNFIKCWNSQANRHQLPIDVKFDFNLRIVYHNSKDLYNGNKYNFGQKCYEFNRQSDYIPTIHLTLFRIFEYQFSKEESKDGNNKEFKIASLARRYRKVIDSSIWNYYVPIMTKESEFDFEYFKHALFEICHNYIEGRYNLNVAWEYVNLHARILPQSYLTRSHKAVSPFLFHSEYEMRIKIEDMVLNEKSGKNKKIIEKVKEFKWRFLLVDDKSIRCMSKVSLNGNDSNDVNKLQVISNNLIRILGFNEEQIWFRTEFKESQDPQKKELVPSKYGKVNDFENGEFTTAANKKPDKEKNIQIIIDCVESIDEAEYCLKNYEYEVMLLDYLLAEGTNRKQEYGYQLLKDLQELNDNDKNESFRVGPNNSLTVMFISAFTTAVHERIIEMGLGRNEKGLWHIGNSACPTNTPYLFSYLLLQLMRHRIKDLSQESEGGQMTIIDLLEKIYVKTYDGVSESVQRVAYSHFNHLLFMRDKYARLAKDFSIDDEKYMKGHPDDARYIMDMKSSFLVYSAFKVVHHFSEAFFNHLQHLVYLTAFGTIRQWQEMWEEYVFIYNELCEYDKYVVEYDEDNNVRKRGKIICNAIKEYIINLKENSI